jgi:hypothetical protein
LRALLEDRNHPLVKTGAHPKNRILASGDPFPVLASEYAVLGDVSLKRFAAVNRRHHQAEARQTLVPRFLAQVEQALHAAASPRDRAGLLLRHPLAWRVPPAAAASKPAAGVPLRRPIGREIRIRQRRCHGSFGFPLFDRRPFRPVSSSFRREPFSRRGLETRRATSPGPFQRASAEGAAGRQRFM